METQTQLKERLEAERKALGMDYRQYGAYLKMPWSTYYNWISGQRRLGLFTLMRLQQQRPDLLLGSVVNNYLAIRRQEAEAKAWERSA